MAEIVEGAGILLRIVLGLIFMFGPGFVFWLAVVGIVAAIRRAGDAHLFAEGEEVIQVPSHRRSS